MWIFSQHGFYSVVKKESTWNIRARAKQDLLNLGLTPLKSYPGSDYPWRVIVQDKTKWEEIMQQLAASVDYPNFKGKVGQIPDQKHRLHQYHHIWSIMAQEDEAES